MSRAEFAWSDRASRSERLTGIDKASHAAGHDSREVHEALRIVDETAATIRRDAEQSGRWDAMHLWITSDHGHSPVTAHDDIAVLMRSLGHQHDRASVDILRWSGRRGDGERQRHGAHLPRAEPQRIGRGGPRSRDRWEPTVTALLARAAVDLVILPHSVDEIEVRHRDRGAAMITVRERRYAYRPLTGDPLGHRWARIAQRRGGVRRNARLRLSGRASPGRATRERSTLRRDHSLRRTRLGFSRAQRTDPARVIARGAAPRPHARAVVDEPSGRPCSSPDGRRDAQRAHRVGAGRSGRSGRRQLSGRPRARRSR